MLLKRVAVGGMAELYLAKDTRNERFVILKRILPYLAEEEEFVRMFLDEARIASVLHHPHVVEVFELGRLDGSTFIAMEWVDGIDLRKILQKEQARGGVIPFGVVAYVVARLCEGLHYAHEKLDSKGMHLGIVHRDISPQNIMVGFNANVKLVDFGIAKATAWMSRSKPGVIKGKFLYLAPEQLSQEALDARADLFAMGTLLYELTTGKSPFYRTSTEAVIYAIRVEDPPLPQTVKRGYPLALSKIVMRCLQKDRARRYQTALEIAQDLDALTSGEMPTTRQDVANYIAQLFGDDNERTSLYVPPNAQTQEAEQSSQLKTASARRPAIAPPLATSPFAALADERTLSVPTERLTRQGESEKGTSPISLLPSKRNEKPPPPIDSNVTAPILAEKGNAPVAYARAGQDEIEDTSLSVSGAAKVPIGGRHPQAKGEVDSASLPRVDTPEASKRSRLAPPIPSSQNIPEISDDQVLSVLNETGPVQKSERARRNQNAPLESEPDPFDKLLSGSSLETDTRPQAMPAMTPAPPPKNKLGTGARPKTSRPLGKSTPIRSAKPLPPVDADDLVETADMKRAPKAGVKVRKRTLFVPILIGLALMMGGGLAVALFWPDASPKNKPNKPKKTATVEVVSADAGTQPIIQFVKVSFTAAPKTRASIAGVAIDVTRQVELPVGPLLINYECAPKKKRQAAHKASIAISLPAVAEAQVVDLPCQ
jgi:eukaryotic-like serine/threonine-protein kinase